MGDPREERPEPADPATTGDEAEDTDQPVNDTEDRYGEDESPA